MESGGERGKERTRKTTHRIEGREMTKVEKNEGEKRERDCY